MATIQDRNAPQQSVYPRSHVGFDSITSQIERKLLKRGFQFNVICVGECDGPLAMHLLTLVLQDKLV
jgi:septin 3/9/12